MDRRCGPCGVHCLGTRASGNPLIRLSDGASNPKLLPLIGGTALFPFNARQSNLNVAGQGLPDHLGIEGAHIMDVGA
jgi:hypothetical protein